MLWSNPHAGVMFGMSGVHGVDRNAGQASATVPGMA